MWWRSTEHMRKHQWNNVSGKYWPCAFKLGRSFLMKVLFYFIILTMVNILTENTYFSSHPRFKILISSPIFVTLRLLCWKNARIAKVLLFRIYAADFIENWSETVKFGKFPYFVRVIFGSGAYFFPIFQDCLFLPRPRISTVECRLLVSILIIEKSETLRMWHIVEHVVAHSPFKMVLLNSKMSLETELEKQNSNSRHWKCRTVQQ